MLNKQDKIVKEFRISTPSLSEIVNGSSFTLEKLNASLPENKKYCACLSENFTAKIIGISSSSLANYRKDGLGPKYLKADRGKRARVLYPKESIVEWINNTIQTA